MHVIPKPKAVVYNEGTEAHTGTFEIQACYPGYGTTLGNAMRRVLLSSLEGAAITSVQVKGVTHEFSAIDGVKEDVVQMILNLKKVRFRAHGEGPFKVTLSAKGEGDVTAADIKASSDVEVVNGEHHIATLTEKKSELNLEITVETGIGYVAVDQQNREEIELGAIAIDAIYTPVKRVNYNVENMRVGKRTDYEKVSLEIVTDGSITPQEAFDRSVAILVDQFQAIANGGAAEVVEEASAEEDKE